MDGQTTDQSTVIGCLSAHKTARANFEPEDHHAICRRDLVTVPA